MVEHRGDGTAPEGGFMWMWVMAGARGSSRGGGGVGACSSAWIRVGVVDAAPETGRAELAQVAAWWGRMTGAEPQSRTWYVLSHNTHNIGSLLSKIRMKITQLLLVLRGAACRGFSSWLTDGKISWLFHSSPIINLLLNISRVSRYQNII